MPDGNILQLLINSSGAGLVTALFIYYQLKKDKLISSQATDQSRIFADTLKDFNVTLKDYLRDSIRTKQELAQQLQRVGDVLMYLEKKMEIKDKLLKKKGDIHIVGQMKV